MTEVQDIPVSITYTGETMQRKDVVTYLQQFCIYHIASDELSEQKERLENEIKQQEAKYDSSKWKKPSETPPKREFFGAAVWVIIIVLVAKWLLGLSSGLVFRGIVVGIAALLIWLFIWSSQTDYKDRCKNWEKEKEEYAQKLKWLEEQKASYVDGRPKEIAEVEKVVEDVCKTLEFAKGRLKWYESREILPEEMREWPIPVELFDYFNSGRVNTLSEAINLFHTERHNQRLLQLQEEIRMREEAMMQQQNLNAARLSEQINAAKNEIEMDNWIQSCFVQDRLDSIYREVRDQW